MHDILDNFSDTELVKTTIRANWENYHYCLGRSPRVELSVGRYLTWLVTGMPDHFINLVVGTAVTSKVLFEAQKLGYHVGILQASQMGYKVYQRLGFEDFGKLDVFLWDNETNT